MANFVSTHPEPLAFSSLQFSEDSQIWDGLKQAIAKSSGFQRWKLESELEHGPIDSSLDEQVQSYLRETLETLAY